MTVIGTRRDPAKGGGAAGDDLAAGDVGAAGEDVRAGEGHDASRGLGELAGAGELGRHGALAEHELVDGDLAAGDGAAGERDGVREPGGDAEVERAAADGGDLTWAGPKGHVVEGQREATAVPGLHGDAGRPESAFGRDRIHELHPRFECRRANTSVSRRTMGYTLQFDARATRH